ncbi:efflux RND transporter periplasmic adaptor subunit [Yoonia vestfoldensis]|uniref:Putative efflux pump membrane fusion protein n=1 Tax=Yoonia vestfoldensis TaxID=245188 RepID=A0A1Y0EHH1_9RHOB|nr:efflux RND transporter periplasmic adaptor subunit [Yoonia vestfoldensis]ARU03076.1 putative efflux pump membrane fusion protein [Yoonia vestfoldensis]
MTQSVTSTLRRVMTLGLTLAVFGGAGATVYAGFALIAAQGDAGAVAVAPVSTVEVLQIEIADSYRVTRRFTGQIEAAARIDLGFELGGRVTEMLVDEGDIVAKGVPLARLDTSALVPQRAALEAELAALVADAELAQLTLSRADALLESGFRSVAAQDDARLALARAQAGIAAAHARIAGVDVQIAKSVLTAPFAARIGARLADPGQTVAAGQNLLVLFDAGPAQARVGLPPDLAARLRVGQSVTLEIGGATHQARIRQIRPDLDPGTRSRSVVVTLPAGLGPVLGDTVALVLAQVVPEPGFWAPLSALREGARGSWSVMALDPVPDGARIVSAAVEVIHADGAQVYLRGQLPAGARIVAQAPDRVAPGQIVQLAAGPQG